MSESPTTDLSTRYEPGKLEAEIYQRWEQGGHFTPPPQPRGKPFTIMIPPPNVTGVLHMGHALNNTMQDIVIRHRRMCGYDALWVPGTDHAGIATQAVVEKKLYKEQGIKREELGREAFLDEVWKWKEHHGNAILQQLRRLGASCDWSRTKFTFDPEMSRAVRVSFVRLWEKGLVYRGPRMVNWDCTLQTAVGDDEIEMVTRKDKLYYLKYPVVGREGEHVTVATTRPETMLGDTGVAVNPEDDRYASLQGCKLLLPLVDREIPLVADDSVRAEFGTGAVKVTPGHDPEDYERGARHKLPTLNILNKDGSLNEEAGRFAGMKREKAREAILAAMDEIGLLEKIEDYEHTVPISDRSKDVIEPLVSEQWFVKMEALAGPAIEAVHNGSLKLKPERWAKVYLDWLLNVRDWCISRQLWWGHRIPVWYDEDGETVASVDDLQIGDPHPKTGKPIVRQDEDVLDTWASSWLWPWATLGWPDQTEDMARFYPTQFLSTARDIIYLWVARMVMGGYELLDHLPEEQRCPFATCYVHATVLDGQGRRMSKSLGNGIDPVEMIDQYGADAVRYTLMILTREGQDVKLAVNRFEDGQRFCNKVWNAARFVLQNLEGEVADEHAEALEDAWIRSRLATTTREVSDALDGYHFHDAAHALRRFTWDDFCDWYVEAAKRRLRAGEGAGPGTPAAEEAARVRRTLGETLSALLRLLHPFTPFLTEALWAALPETFRRGQSLILHADWPGGTPGAFEGTDLPAAAGAPNEAAEAGFALIQDAVRAFRNVRALQDLSPSARPAGIVSVRDEASEGELAAVQSNQELLQFLASLGSVEIGRALARPASSGTDAFLGGAIFLPFGEETDPAKLRESLERKLQRAEKGLGSVDKKLANERFVQNADPEVVESEKARRAQLDQEVNTLRANLAGLSA